MNPVVDFNYNSVKSHCDDGLSSVLSEKEGHEDCVTPTLNDENEAAVPASAGKVDDEEEQQIMLARRKRKNERKRLTRQLKNRLKETIITLEILYSLSTSDATRLHFLNGSNGALKISLEDLVMLNSLHRLIRNPASTPFTTSDDNTLNEEQFETLKLEYAKATNHLTCLLEGRNSSFEENSDVTYHHVKVLINKIAKSAYFKRESNDKEMKQNQAEPLDSLPETAPVDQQMSDIDEDNSTSDEEKSGGAISSIIIDDSSPSLEDSKKRKLEENEDDIILLECIKKPDNSLARFSERCRKDLNSICGMSAKEHPITLITTPEKEAPKKRVFLPTIPKKKEPQRPLEPPAAPTTSYVRHSNYSMSSTCSAYSSGSNADYEMRSARHPPRGPDYRKFSSYRDRSDHRRPEIRMNENYRYRDSDRNSHRLHRNGPSEEHYRRDYRQPNLNKRACFQCKEFGHLKANCPNKRHSSSSLLTFE